MGGQGATAVVVTGAAAIGPHGHGTEPLLDALRAGRPLCGPLPEPAPSAVRRRCREAVRRPELDLSEWLTPRAARRMSRLSQWAVVGGRMALQSAAWNDAAADRLATCLASVFGPSDFINLLLQQILRDSPLAASPFLFTDCVANAPAGQLAIAVQARAANFTISQREAGPLLSLIQGVREIQGGRADAVLVGSVDEVEEHQVAVLDRMRVLAPTGAEVRPFDRRRCGFLCGEGAGLLLLEAEANARQRGAPVLARVRGMARGFDPTAAAAGWGRDPVRLARALGARLAADGIEARSIDLVVSGASGSRPGDRVEAATLRELFGAELPPVLAPKAVVGEYGVGGVLVPGVLALRGGPFAAPAGFGEVDPELGIHPRPCDLARPRRVLLTAQATGGAAAWVVLERGH